MNTGWELKKLGDVLLIERGGSPRPIEKYITSSPDGINWIKISDATASNKFIYTTAQKISRDGLHKTRIVNEGDFILSNSMSFGRPYIMKTSGAIHDGWLVLKQNSGKKFETEFLYYLLSSPFVFEQFDSLAAGSTVRNLNIALVRSVLVPIPPLSEQERIVSILVEAFAAIAKARENAEKNLQNAKELFETFLQGVFENKGEGWAEKRLGEVCSLITKGSSPKWQGVNYVDEPGVLFVTSENVGEGEMLLQRRKYVEEKFNRKDKKSILKKGDVLTNIVGASIGRTAIYSIDDVANINQAVCILRCNPSVILNDFLMNLLNSKYFREILHSNEVNTARANLSLAFFNNLIIPIPPLQKQSSIVKLLKVLSAETKKLDSIYQQKLSNLEELKKTILQKAFSGELTQKEIPEMI